jgi:hypothetical protein
LLNTCPHHGFETWRLISHFYEGLTPKDRQIVESHTSINLTLEDKDRDEAMEYLDLLAENAQIRTPYGLVRHRVKLNPIHQMEACTTLGKIMTLKIN